jgi:hypothetical protein
MEEIAADQNRRVAAAMARAPAPIAALIERAPCRLTLWLTLDSLYQATSREGIRRAAGYCEGVAFGAHMAREGAVWTAEEWGALTDHICGLEVRALAARED